MMGVIPATIVALIPTFTCPSCWPFYIGLLSSLGIGAYDFTDSLMPVMVVALGISLASLGYKAKSRHGYRPFIIGVIASAMILSGKVLLASDALTYTGTFLLIVASLWNSQGVQGLRSS